MVQISLFALALVSASYSVSGAPLVKRIDQVISDSTAKWEKACDAAGGGAACNELSVAAFSTLLAAPGPCEQQNAADKMIDLAKTLKSDPTMIALAQIFRQQPRNTPSSQAVPYCQQPPKNAELNGLFQCQFQGADEKTFVGGIAAGQPGTIPFGMNATVSPAGSCPAHPDGPITDRAQLVDLTQDPGVGGAAVGSGSANSTTSTDPSTSTSSAAPEASSPAADSSSTTSEAPPAATDAPSCNMPPPDAGAADPDASADPTASATADPVASSSAAAESSAPADSTTSSTVSPDPSATTAAPAASSSASAGSGDFHLANGQNAQKLNAKFATLDESSPCTDGEQACVKGGFAQCVSGKFAVTQCAGGTICAALPLVNKEGTSIACTTQADAEARIKATGATGGVTGA